MKVAIYLRISKDDGELCESSSISGQRFLLLDYIKSMDSEEKFTDLEIMEFIDEGYSGVIKDRPALKSLLEYVVSDKVNMIMVKDFSRFSRDYMWLAGCMFRLFPAHNVRFISVNDNYDSNMEEIPAEAGFLSIFYDYYSRELSYKVKKSIHSLQQQGKYVSACAPFGYKKNPADIHELIIDKEQSEIVKSIFCDRLCGMSTAKIADKLNNKGIKTARGCEFSSAGISHILRNPVYIGTMVTNKTVRNMPARRGNQLTKDRWNYIENQHEPIVSREDFEKVQLMTRKQIAGNYVNRSWWYDKVFCGKCGIKLVHRKGKYICTSCGINIMESRLKEKVHKLVMEIIRIMGLSETKCRILNEIKKEQDIYFTNKIEKKKHMEKRLTDMEKNITDDSDSRCSDKKIKEILYRRGQLTEEINRLKEKKTEQNKIIEGEINSGKLEEGFVKKNIIKLNLIV